MAAPNITPTIAATSAAHTAVGVAAPNVSASLSSAPSAALQPAPVPIGVFADYSKTASESIFSLTSNRISLSGGDATVSDVHGKTAFVVKAKTLSLHSRKEVYNAEKKHLFTLTKRLVSFHTTYDIADAAYPDKTVASISQKTKHNRERGDELKVTFHNTVGDGKEIHLHLKGSLRDKDAEITLDKQPIARIAHTFNDAKWSLKAKETYALSVAANVDAALMVALTIALDDLDDDIKE